MQKQSTDKRSVATKAKEKRDIIMSGRITQWSTPWISTASSSLDLESRPIRGPWGRPRDSSNVIERAPLAGSRAWSDANSSQNTFFYRDSDRLSPTVSSASDSCTSMSPIGFYASHPSIIGLGGGWRASMSGLLPEQRPHGKTRVDFHDACVLRPWRSECKNLENVSPKL